MVQSTKRVPFFSEDGQIALVLYIDEFEICNPLGTSRKKLKITAVYCFFGNMPHMSQSTLNSIYLALLCKSVDIKRFGYDEVLAPLIKDLAILECDGVYISSVGQNVKGSVFCVVADNLGAHSISGLVESFSGPYICRFCLGHRSEYQTRGEVIWISRSHQGQTCLSFIDDEGKSNFDTLLWCKKGLPPDRTSEPLPLCHRLST